MTKQAINGQPALYNATSPTLTDGDGAGLNVDINGNLKVTLVAPTTVPVSVAALPTGGYSFLNIAAGIATTVVKASAGTLHSIILNSAALATNVTTVYDNATGVGTVIAIPAVTTATVPTTLLFDLAFANGLTIITATANGGNMTIVYK